MVTMTSEVDKTKTTIAMATKQLQNTLLISPTITESEIIVTSNINHTNTIANNGNVNGTKAADTNGFAADISNVNTREVTISTTTRTPTPTPTTLSEETTEHCDNSSLKKNTENNIVTVEICCNTETTEAATPTTTTTIITGTINTSAGDTNATTSASTKSITFREEEEATTTTTTTTTTTNNKAPNTSTTDDLSILSSSCHQKTSHPLLHFQQHSKSENAPNILVYKKMETIIEKMQAEGTGVTVRTVKGFMTKVPSVFTGTDLIAWILKNLDIDDITEALHFAHLLSAHGYIFPIDDHCLTVKNDGTFYRFQTPYFWPSNCWEPENTDYAVYLCKRTMQNKTRLELADYEAENLAKLQKMFSRKWEFIFMQAESQSKVAKKRDKLERKVLDSQERAFWDVHRPMPGCVNTTEIDIKKAYRRGGSSHGTGSAGASVAKNPIELLTRIISLRQQKVDRRTIKTSKAAEALVSYFEQYYEFDCFVSTTELPNPWQTDSTEMWDAEKNSKEVPLRNVKRWAFSMQELLKDPVGREQFSKFLEKEYSVENILFWEAVQEMKTLPQSAIKESIHKIWQEFLAPDAPYAVNVDSKSIELARDAVNTRNPNRWCFDVAAAHIYHLMERDSYPRYLRSDIYKDFLNCSRKKVKSIPNLFGVKR